MVKGLRWAVTRFVIPGVRASRRLSAWMLDEFELRVGGFSAGSIKADRVLGIQRDAVTFVPFGEARLGWTFNGCRLN